MGRCLIVVVLLLVLVAALITLAITAVQQWGLPGLAAVVVAFLILGQGVRVLAGNAVRSAFTSPFRMKGSVLKDARVTIHSVEPTDPPAHVLDRWREDGEAAASDEPHEPADEENEEDLPHPSTLEWWRVEATITPTATPTTFQLWEVGELLLTVPGASEEPEDDPEYSLESLEVLVEGEFKEDEGYKLPGEHRIRFVVGVAPGTERLVFRYYFELFGEVPFPRRVTG